MTFLSIEAMNSSQFRRYLAKRGCTFEEGKKHTIAKRNGRSASVARHGGRKQLGLGIMQAIKKALEIED